MKTSHLLLTLTAAVASMQMATAADVVGKITLTGTPPPEGVINMDQACGKLHGDTKVTTTFYTVAADKGLADVFVHVIKGLEGKKFEAPASSVVLDQVGCVYVPYVAGAQTGQKIEVKNSDPFMHNVHPTPTAAGNKEVNKAQMPKTPAITFSWDKPEVFLRFKCDVHPWMFSYVGLVDHPFYAVTAKDGSFKIANLPDGNYTIEAIHRKAGKKTQDITVKGGNVTANFELAVPAPQ